MKTAGRGAVPEPTANGERARQQEPAASGRRGLTSRQSLFWLDEQLFPDSRDNNLILTIDVNGPLNVPQLMTAWRKTVLSFDALRTVVDRTKPLQFVICEVPDLPIVSIASPEALPRWLEQFSTRAIGLGQDSLRWDAALVRVSAERHMFCVCQHHMIADGLSMLLMAEHLSQLYLGHEPARPATFEDYGRSELEYQQGARTDRDREFWLSKLPVGLPALHLYGHQRIDASAALTRRNWAAGSQRTEQLRALSQEHPFRAITPSFSRLAILVTALTAFLYRASGQREILIGIPFANRPSRFARTYGLLFEQLFLNLEMSEGETFESLGIKVREELTASIRHGQYCVSDRGLQYVTLNMLPPLPKRFGDLSATYFLGPATVLARGEDAGTNDLRNTFGLEVNDFAEGDLQLSLDMHSATFDQVVRDRAGTHLLRIIDGMLADLTTPVDAVELIDEAERGQLLEAGRGPEPAGDAPDLIEMFRAQAAAMPTKAAVEAPDGTFSYSELDRLSDVLAGLLWTKGVRGGARVGVSFPRGCGEIVSFLAVLKMGCAYIPIDPSFPRERIRLLLGDARPEVLITPANFFPAEVLPHGTALFEFDHTRLSDGTVSGPLAFDAPSPEQIAYILFTSGSTGRPKGVEVQRSALANFLRSMSVWPGLGAQDRLLAVTTTTFDIAGLEMFLPLWVGATVVIADADTARDPRLLRARLERRDITVMQATPVTWRLLLEAGWEGIGARGPGLRMLCGGDKLSQDLANRLLATGGELWNLYGPTETTIWSTVEQVGCNADRITIGRPIDHTQVYVLDSNQRLVPPGIVGELYIGGRGVARGYFGRPDLTAERFLPDPFRGPKDRIYLTGDMARLRDDGRFECLGRKDNQVKIRGFRIEVEEIEAELRKVPGVDEALVTASPDPRGDAALCAYWAGSASAKELQDHLRSRLPGYMVPSAFAHVADFPLNTSGKIDRTSLLPPAYADGAGSPDGMPLRTVKEERMAAIWSDILRTVVANADQDFFDLGGTSVQVIELRLAVEKAFGVRLPLRVFFDAPTIANLVNALGEVDDPSEPIVVPLRRRLEGQPVLHCLLGIELYRDLAQCLPDDIGAYGLHVPYNFAAVHSDAIKDLASQYVQCIRVLQTGGPYHLAGLCMGGLIAFEAARQLEAAGEKVGSVSLFDAAMPPVGFAGVLVRLWKLKTKAKQLLAWPSMELISLARRRTAEPKVPGLQTLEDAEVEAQVRRYLAEQHRLRSPLLVFRAAGQKTSLLRKWDMVTGWKGRSPFLSFYDVRAGHLDVVRKPHVQEVADRIAAEMSKVELAEMPAACGRAETR